MRRIGQPEGAYSKEDEDEDEDEGPVGWLG